MKLVALFLGFLLHAVGFRKELLRANLGRAFPNLSPAEAARLERANYRHYGELFAEFLASFGRFARFLETKCESEGVEHLRSALAGGKGALVMTAHLGNWEVLPSYGSHILKIPVTMVTKRLKPAWLHSRIEATRAKVGTRMAYEPRTMRQVLHALRRNEVVGFAIDQFAGYPVGARVPFFGVPVGTNTALAVLAQRTGAPVVPAFAIRGAGGVFRCIFLPAIESSGSAASENSQTEQILRETARYNRIVEEWVRRHPEQWMWIHRRWKGELSPLAPGRVGEMMKPD